MTLWCDTAICEERASDGTVTRRSFLHGEQVTGQGKFLTADHLRSFVESTDTSGALQARYAYDPWGKREVVAGSSSSTNSYTGHYWDVESSVYHALYRQYDPGLGRWLSEDPIRFEEGPNLYAYVQSRTINVIDPLGLQGVGAAGCTVRCQRVVLGLPIYFCDGGFAHGCSCKDGSGFFFIQGGFFVLPTDLPCSDFECLAGRT